ncbi:4538_t:CDS:2, partial [Racocetra persica]
GVSASIGRVSISSSGVVIVMSGVEGESGEETGLSGSVEEGEVSAVVGVFEAVGDTDAVGGFNVFGGDREDGEGSVVLGEEGFE